MPGLPLSLFGKTKALEAEIDEFLDKVSEGGIVFEEGVTAYVDHGVDGRVERKLHQIVELPDNEASWGMVKKVPHLVRVLEPEDASKSGGGGKEKKQ